MIHAVHVRVLLITVAFRGHNPSGTRVLTATRNDSSINQPKRLSQKSIEDEDERVFNPFRALYCTLAVGFGLIPILPIHLAPTRPQVRSSRCIHASMPYTLLLNHAPTQSYNSPLSLSFPLYSFPIQDQTVTLLMTSTPQRHL